MLRRTCALASIAFVLSLSAATNAMATAQRTFVASNGNDANPCSIVSPCRAFAAAIAQTIAGGEVIVLDSAGYGPVTISQSVSLIAPAGVYAGISVASGNGVTIATAGVAVTLNGLTINGIGGANGILMTDGVSLQVENCTVSGFNLNATAAINISAFAEVVISNTVVTKSNIGIALDGGVNAHISNVKAINNTAQGIVMGGTNNAPTFAIVSESIASHNGDYGFVVLGQNAFAQGGLGACSICSRTMTVVNSSSSGNSGSGMGAVGTGAMMSVSSSTAANNSGFGLNRDFGSTVRSAQNNVLTDNQLGPTIGTITTGGMIF